MEIFLMFIQAIVAGFGFLAALAWEGVKIFWPVILGIVILKIVIALIKGAVKWARKKFNRP